MREVKPAGGLIAVKAGRPSGATIGVMSGPPNPHEPLEIAPIPGAQADTRHPLRAVWRGLGELCAFAGQAIGALGDLFRAPPEDVPPKPPKPREKLRPVEKTAPFPVND